MAANILTQQNYLHSPQSDGSSQRVVAVYHCEDATQELLRAGYLVQVLLGQLNHLEDVEPKEITPANRKRCDTHSHC